MDSSLTSLGVVAQRTMDVIIICFRGGVVSWCCKYFFWSEGWIFVRLLTVFGAVYIGG